MKNLIKLIFLIVPYFCFSNINIKGKIVDKNNVSVPLVNIYIKNTTIGVISNKDGNFEINIPKKYANTTLVFSAMSFETKEINIAELKNDTFITVKLKPRTIVLDEVVLRAKKLTANEIVKKAFDNYYKNFPNKPFIAKGFLRHSEKTKTEYKWLIEAAIEMYDPGFDKASNEVKLNIIEVRKSFDNRVLDTALIYKLYLEEAKGLSFREAWKNTPKLNEVSKTEIQNAINFHDNRQSNPTDLFTSGLNKIRYYNQKGAILDNNILKKHTFKIDTILSFNGDNVYKIKITPASPPRKLNKKIGKYLLPFGWLYVRMNDYAIIELDYTLINSKKGQIFTDINGSRIASNFNIKFVEINNKMYPKYISFNAPKPVNRFRAVNTYLRDSSKYSPDLFYYSKQEIVFDEIITDKKTIDLSLQKPWHDNLFTPHPYHAKFWKNYNVLLENTEQKKMIDDLEKKVKLKEQYNK